MKETTDATKTNGGLATDGEAPFRPGTKLARDHAALTEARLILDRYAPAQGQSYPLNNPSPGEARRMLACIQGLMSVLEGPTVESQPVAMLTR